ncbi:lysine histidine transporter-like 8 [Telopea speciosissima]|uniref:lysine histidine transporter-like 8 n=1 Tax=Telopea speciosissima TaxID=54955 RepID=UPI001CC622BD|nr:lysine histidine transporter-like 8 [Telopea speciosissima]
MEEDLDVVRSAPITPRTTPPISAPPSQFHSPSLTRSPLLYGDGDEQHTPREIKAKTPTSRTPRFISPLATPLRKALHLTKLDHEDAWLPITESRNGNAFYAAFHTLSSGIGIQALVLPVAFTFLGWSWGVTTLTLAFIWQLYTLWVLVQLHESASGTRYNRYLTLLYATFGERLGKILGVIPIMYLSGATCVLLVIVGGSTLKMFFQTVCGVPCTAKPLTTVEWYLVFTCTAVLLSQLPNLNSIAGVSLVGAVTAIGYCTLIWVVSVKEGKLLGVSYEPIKSKSDVTRVFSVLNALGIIAFAFRGHNLTLEIQATMPSSEKHPSHVPMWKGVKAAYILIAMCLFPIAIGGYWAYGQLIPANGGMLTALFAYHGRDTSRALLGLISLFVIVNAVSSFQIYGMPMFDLIESHYTSRKKKALPWWLRSIFRTVFGFVVFFFAVAIPFLGSLAGLIGGFALPVTLAYPCFMWIVIKKPKRFSVMWWLNWVLGIMGMVLSGLLVAAGLWTVIDTGIKANFFKPN